MIRAIAYKEWLKIRWVTAAIFVACLTLMTVIALSVRRDFTFNSPMAVWNAICFLGYQYYAILKYAPLAIGAVIASAQFVPEVIASRLILSLHLPMRENGMMLRMLSVGFLVVTAFLLFLAAALWGISAYYFPWEITRGALSTAFPWFLAGWAGYLAIATIIVEPRWIQRGLLFLVAAGLVDLLMTDAATSAFLPSFHWIAGLTACLGIAILFTAHRFRRGLR